MTRLVRLTVFPLLLMVLWSSIVPAFAELSSKATLATPVPGSTIGGTVTFQWTSGTGVSGYWFEVGTSGVGSKNLYNSAVSGTSATVSGLPTSGTIYVRLYSKIDGEWLWNDYTYTGGAAPAISVTPTSLSFEQTTVNATSAAQSITVTNTGTATLAVSSVSLSGPDSALFSQTNTCSSVVAGSSCTISVTFTPTSTGSKSASISIVHNANGSPTTVSLAGSTTTSGKATLSSPIPGSTIGGTVTFQWTSGTGVSGYWFEVGTSGVGSKNLYNSAVSGTSATVSGLPTSGTIYVRLYSKIDGEWLWNDYTYTGTAKATLSSPTPGSTIGGTVTFQWTSGTGVSGYWFEVGTSGVGSKNLYNGAVSGTSATVSGLPTSGTIYVRLYSKIDGEWLWSDYTFTGAVPAASFSTDTVFFSGQLVGATSQKQNIGMLNRGATTLTVHSVDFVGRDAAQFSQTNTCSTLAPGGFCNLWVAFTPTSEGGKSASLVVSHNSTGSPGTVSVIGNSISPAKATLKSPVPGSTIGGTVTFEWASGIGVTSYWLEVGTEGVGSKNLFNGGVVGTSKTVEGLPTTGTIYVRLYSKIGDEWQWSDFTFQGGVSPAIRVSSVEASFPQTVVGLSSGVAFITVTNTGSGVLNISNVTLTGADSQQFSQVNTCANVASGSSCEIRVTFRPTSAGNKSSLIAISHNASGAPSTILVTGSAIPAVKAVLLSPTPSSTIGASAAFQWTSGTGVSGYWLELGTEGIGTKNLYNRGVTGTAVNLSGLPTSGTIYVRLYSKIGDDWLWNDYTLTGSAKAMLVSPALGSRISGTVNFRWTSGTGVSGYWFEVGTSGVGSKNLYNSAVSGTSATVSGLPTSGTIYVRLYSKIGDDWQWNDYRFDNSSPTIVVNPTAVSFSQTVGTTSTTQSISVSTSNNSLFGVTVRLLGPDENQFVRRFSTCSGIVVSGSCSIDIAFSPTTIGRKSAFLEIVTSLSGNPIIVDLSGTAVAPQVVTGSLAAACIGASCGALDSTTYAGSGVGVWGYTNTSSNPAKVNVALTGVKGGNKVTLVFSNGGKATAPTVPGFGVIPGSTASQDMPSQSTALAPAESASDPRDVAHSKILESNREMISVLRASRSSRIFVDSDLSFSGPLEISVAPTIGSQRIWKDDAFGGVYYKTSARATCRALSGRVIVFWIDDFAWNGRVTSSIVEKFKNAYCGTTGAYERLVKLYGEPWGAHPYSNLISDAPTLQNLNVVMVSSSAGYGGYFWGVNAYKEANSQSSNGALAFFINVSGFRGDSTPLSTTNYYISALVHEMVHMVNFYQRSVRRSEYHDTWLEETSAMTSEDIITPAVIGYNKIETDRLAPYLRSGGNVSYINWQTLSNNSYAIGGAFAAFMNRRYGLNFFKALQTCPSDSYSCVDSFINLNGGGSFASEFARMGASVFSRMPSSGLPGQYGFPMRVDGEYRLNAIDVSAFTGPNNGASVSAGYLATSQTFIEDTVVAGKSSYVRNEVLVPAGTSLTVIVQ